MRFREWGKFLCAFVLVAGGRTEGCDAFAKLALVGDPTVHISQSGRSRMQLFAPTGWLAAPFNGLASVAASFLGLRILAQKMHRAGPLEPGNARFDQLMGVLGLKAEADPAALARIPRDGPLIFVTNHPLSGPDLLSVAQMAAGQREQGVKIVMNKALSGIEAFQDIGFFVKGKNEADAATYNRAPGRHMLQWLRAGNTLVMAPVTPDAKGWDAGVTQLARITGATIVPAFVDKQPPPFFQRVRNVSPPAADALAGLQLLALEGSSIPVRFGEPIPAERLRDMGSTPEEVAETLRQITYGLGSR